MSDKKNTPAIRFRGFSEEWEEIELGKICSIAMGQSPSSSNYTQNSDDKVLIQGNADIKNGLIVPRVWTTEVTKETKKGDIIMTVRAPVGDIAVTDFDAVIGRGVVSIKGNKFIYYNLNKKQLENFWDSISSGSTFESITSNDVINTIINLPNSKPEQTKIGSFFENLDQLLTKHQTKHQKLQALKKAMLSKLFPKKGATTPEIRFKGFTEDWEVKTLGEIGKCTSGTSLESEFISKGRYKVISIGSYSENSKYTDQGLRTILNDKTEKRILNKGDLTMVLNDKTASGRILGRVLLIPQNDKFVYNQRTQRIEPKEEFSSNFIYHYLNAPLIRKKIFDMAQGNTQIYVNWSAISELEYLIPQKQEQQQIGNYFKNLDTLITKHATQIEKLGAIKKACLSKMFV